MSPYQIIAIECYIMLPGIIAMEISINIWVYQLQCEAPQL